MGELTVSAAHLEQRRRRGWQPAGKEFEQIGFEVAQSGS
jgi:hypothetical protein